MPSLWQQIIYIFYKHLSKYNHLSHPNAGRNQTKSIARMYLNLKEKIENKREKESVSEEVRETQRERKTERERESV